MAATLLVIWGNVPRSRLEDCQQPVLGTKETIYHSLCPLMRLWMASQKTNLGFSLLVASVRPCMPLRKSFRQAVTTCVVDIWSSDGHVYAWKAFTSKALIVKHPESRSKFHLYLISQGKYTAERVSLAHIPAGKSRTLNQSSNDEGCRREDASFCSSE